MRKCSTVLECCTVFPRGVTKHNLNSNTKHMNTLSQSLNFLNGGKSDQLTFQTFSMVKAKNSMAAFKIDGLCPIGKLIHESKTAKYYKHSNGVVQKVYKVKDQTMPNTKKVTVSNDNDGLLLINTLLKPMGIKRRLYRVPNDGLPYSAHGNFLRNGNIQKFRAKIIDVYMK